MNIEIGDVLKGEAALKTPTGSIFKAVRKNIPSNYIAIRTAHNDSPFVVFIENKLDKWINKDIIYLFEFEYIGNILQ